MSRLALFSDAPPETQEPSEPCVRCKRNPAAHEIWKSWICRECVGDWFQDPRFEPKSVCGALGLSPSAHLGQVDAQRHDDEYVRRTAEWAKAGPPRGEL